MSTEKLSEIVVDPEIEAEGQTEIENMDENKESQIHESEHEDNNICQSCSRMNCPCGESCACGEFCKCIIPDSDVLVENTDKHLVIANRLVERNENRHRFRVHMAVVGAHCSACVLTVTRALRLYFNDALVEYGGTTDDLKEVLVSLSNADFIVDVNSNEKDITMIEDGSSMSEIIIKKLAEGASEAIEDAGFDVEILDIEDVDSPHVDKNKVMENDESFSSPQQERTIVLDLQPVGHGPTNPKSSIEKLLRSVTSNFGSDPNNKTEKSVITHLVWEEPKKKDSGNNSPAEYLIVTYIPVLLATASSSLLKDVDDKEVKEDEGDLDQEQSDAKEDNESGGSRSGLQLLLDLMHQAGYNASVEPLSSSSASNTENKVQQHAQAQRRQVLSKRREFLISLIFTVPVILVSMVFSKIPMSKPGLNIHPPSVPSFTIEVIILWLFATPVQFYSGWAFYRGSYRGIRNRILGMDVLVATGTSAAYGYAVYQVLSGVAQDLRMNKMGPNSHGDFDGHNMRGMGAHFFETSAVLISFVLLGQWMQLLATRRTSLALTKLLGLRSRTANLVTPLILNDSTRMIAQDSNSFDFDPTTDLFHVEEVPTSIIRKGDILQIIRGSGIPADGKVISGSISVDESMITGESLPVLKSAESEIDSEDKDSPKSKVIGGTVAVEGIAYMSVTGVGKETTLSQIVQLMEHAQMSRVPIQEFADKVSGIFVPVVCAIATVSFIIWMSLCATNIVPREWYEDKNQSSFTFSFLFGVTVLVISCPCALGLATPTAVMVGTGVGATNGILIKSGESLQNASSIQAVVFDKTGTLTQGKPCVTDFENLSSTIDDKDILWYLGTLEKNSEHPLGAAIVSYASKIISRDETEPKPFGEPTTFSAVTGKGVSCYIEGNSVAVGNRTFAASKGWTIADKPEEMLISLEDEGKTAVIAAINNEVVAVIGISDEIRKDSASTISALMKEGIDVWMVTGDNVRTATSVAKKLGLPLDKIVSESLPATKVKKIQSLQSEGKKVAMVGDGINDSPALAQAEVGIAIGAGTEIAVEAADMVLVKNEISDVFVAIHLSKKIFFRIKLNFLWALLYNCLGIPIAAGVFYPWIQVSLPPTVAAVAMACSSVSVVTSSLLLKFYRPPDVNSYQTAPSTTTDI